MIRNFKDKEAERIFNLERSKRLPNDIQQTAHKRLKALDYAETLDDLRSPPGNRLEALKGNRSGQYSMRINNQWRVCFEWCEGNACNIEIVDYH